MVTPIEQELIDAALGAADWLDPVDVMQSSALSRLHDAARAYETAKAKVDPTKWATFAIPFDQLGRVQEIWDLGFALSGGPWKTTEIQTVVSAIEKLTKVIPGYKRIFTPMVITRVPKDNVNNGPAMWYAKNVGGYQLVLGNKSFFPGRQSVKCFPGTTFSSEELITHELCHTVNFRYPIEGWSALYQNNKMLGFVARSSDLPAEIMTDAIANYVQGKLKDTARMGKILDEVSNALLSFRQDVPAELQPIMEALSK